MNKENEKQVKMTEILDPMVALMRERSKYHQKKPKERFKKGDRIRAFAGKHDGRVGTVKKVGTARLTMEWDDGTKKRTFCEASHAELLRVYQEAHASAPPAPTTRTTTTTTGSGTGRKPEFTQEGIGEWTHEMIENRLNQMTIDLVAMLRMCDNPNVAWKEAKVRIDAMLAWHQEP